MPPSSVLPLRLDRLSKAWGLALARLALAWAALIWLFRADWAEMAGQWWNSSTYNHILLIPALVIWLVWQRSAELEKIEPRGWWPGLLLASGAVFVWVLGAFAGFSTLRQIGAVVLLIASALGMLGPRVGAGLLFPMGYMLLLVPVGDEFVPLLQLVTARITIAFVQLSGIRATVDGVFIDTPAGLFEVAEACSGVKFLIAMLALGLLAANTCFVSWRRRTLFLAACIMVPVLANGIRAWGTIFLAQYVGAEAATGFDHIVYGWVFFAFVVAVMLTGAWRFFDRPADDPMIDAEAIKASPLLGRLETLRIGALPLLVALTAIVLAAHTWTGAADRLSAQLPPRIFLPRVEGWQAVHDNPAVPWEPRAEGAERRLVGRYRDGRGHLVDVFFALYASQGEGREAGGFGEGALPPGSAWKWLAPGPSIDSAKGERLLAHGHVERVVLTWYRTGTLVTGSNLRLKLANMEDRLLLRSRPTMMLILSAEESQSHSAEETLAVFLRSAGPLDQWMDRMAGLR